MLIVLQRSFLFVAILMGVIGCGESNREGGEASLFSREAGAQAEAVVPKMTHGELPGYYQANLSIQNQDFILRLKISEAAEEDHSYNATLAAKCGLGTGSEAVEIENFAILEESELVGFSDRFEVRKALDFNLAGGSCITEGVIDVGDEFQASLEETHLDLVDLEGGLNFLTQQPFVRFADLED